MFPTEAPADNVTAEEPVAEMANFKYRFYECVPAECDNEDDEAVFAAGGFPRFDVFSCAQQACCWPVDLATMH